jgi:N-acetylgalactosamine-N,N'-diacetylbacillosaminyl-diphospho-undecaprenol 4-alpha-N-acetylgalactosaminyltransferase
VARLIESKFHAKILDTFSQIIWDGDSHWIYMIIWDGPERKHLEERADSLGISENVIFLGAQKNIFKYLNIAQYFVYASRVEGFPNVLGEAMICDLPIITSDFKTGAKECILGMYDPQSEHAKYPRYGPNWVLLDLEDYEKGFIQVYQQLDTLTQKKSWLEHFSIAAVTENIIQFLT